MTRFNPSSMETLLGPSVDTTADPAAGWRHALACGLSDARCLLPPSAIDSVIDATVAEAVALGLIEPTDAGAVET